MQGKREEEEEKLKSFPLCALPISCPVVAALMLAEASEWWVPLVRFWEETKDETKEEYNHGFLPFSEFQTYARWTLLHHPSQVGNLKSGIPLRGGPGNPSLAVLGPGRGPAREEEGRREGTLTPFGLNPR